ncbi:MAG: protein TolR [Gammaproteobacteria bacterium]|nr:protein TolR [Gammaproteobacteria bacterium]
MNNFSSSRHVKRPMAEINLVPFIDVMLVLLVIFMITTPLLTQGVKVDLPQTTAKNIPPEKLEPLVVTVNATGDFYLNTAEKPNQPITARVLANLIATQMNDQSVTEKRPVLVRGDKNANYGKIMEAMVILQQAGAKNIGLVTQPNLNTLASSG